MSRPRAPQPVKLITSLLGGDAQLLETVLGLLQERFGETDYVSEALPFHYTDYYEPEMGPQLTRRLVSFEQLMSPEELPAIKLLTNDLEDRYLDTAGGRRINVDPGYLSLCHLILATCKPFTHRPYLRDGVYADMTLVYRGKRFQTLDWTFPDYGSDGMIKILIMLRERYYEQLKRMQLCVSGES